MPPYRNLISDSLLIKETIDLLRSFGGRLPAVKVVDFVMNIAEPEPDLAKMLARDLAEKDSRLFLNEDHLELVEQDFGRKDLFETEFVVFDLETTGAKTPPCRITEIGAYKIRRGQIREEFQTLINPETPIPPFITQLTGISNQMVRNAPRFSDVAEEFLGFIGDAVLVAHNAHFDMRFLNHEIGRVFENYRMGNPHLCTVHLSRRLLPDLANHRLHTVAEHYAIFIKNRHRAGDDALATANIFCNFLAAMHEAGITSLGAVQRLKVEKRKHFSRCAAKNPS